MPVHRSSAYPLCLLAGTLLIIVAGAVHPDLMGDGAAQLGMIARTDGWRAIHWAFLFGFGLSLTGLAGSFGGAAVATRSGIIVGAFAYSAWMIVVTFMLGAGWALGHSYAVAEPGMAATNAVFLYDMLRPFALTAQRIAGFTLGLSTALLGWGVLGGAGGLTARRIGWAGVGSGVVSVALAVLFGEATKADQAAFVPPVLWQCVVAGLLARRPDAV